MDEPPSGPPQPPQPPVIPPESPAEPTPAPPVRRRPWILGRAGLVLTAVVLAAGFAGNEVRKERRRAALDRFKAADAQWDCCASGRDRPECAEALATIRRLAQGSDDVAYVARVQYVPGCTALEGAAAKPGVSP